MTKNISAITFAKPGTWTTGELIQAIVVEEQAEELRAYAKSLGYEENPRGPITLPASDRQYEERLNKDFKEFFNKE